LAHILYAFSGLIIVASQLLPTLPALAVSSSDSLEVTAIVPGPPPTVPAVIQGLINNGTVTVTPMTLSGTCGVGLTVRLYDNGTEVGHAECGADGRFVINFSLMFGRNDLSALNFDSLNQAGPASDTITIFVVSLAGEATNASGALVRPGIASRPGSTSSDSSGGGGSTDAGVTPTPRPDIQDYFDRVLPLGSEWVLLGGMCLGGFFYTFFAVLKRRAKRAQS
jgi:hypothetical protein